MARALKAPADPRSLSGSRLPERSHDGSAPALLFEPGKVTRG